MLKWHCQKTIYRINQYYKNCKLIKVIHEGNPLDCQRRVDV